jgi:hypothetical protein
MNARRNPIAPKKWKPGYYAQNTFVLGPDGTNYRSTVEIKKSVSFHIELGLGMWEAIGSGIGGNQVTIINQTIVTSMLGATILNVPPETVNGGVVELRQLMPGESASIKYFRAYTNIGSLNYKVQVGVGGGPLADVPGWGTTATPLSASTSTRTTDRIPSTAPLLLGPLDIVALVVVAFTSAPTTPYGLSISFKNS